jgi:putative two-component system response regulator
MQETGTLQGTILVADDDEEVRNLYVQMLQAHGFQVFQAADGVEAIEVLTKESIDVGLIDILMPRHNGYDVCRIAKANPRTRSIPIFLITGFLGDTERERSVQVGADDLIDKPVLKDELIARLRILVKLKRMGDELDCAESVLFKLAHRLEAREPGSEAHCERVARYSAALGERLGLSATDCDSLRRAGYLHDIGKISIPDAVLSKPGPLNEQERRQMETHSETGEQICSSVGSLQDVLPVIRWHHERLDGGGYPDHLKGDEIPLAVRIVQIVDIYDALVSARSYRPALTSQMAFATIRREVRRGWWDSSIVDELEGLFRNSTEIPGVQPPHKAPAPEARRQVLSH